jgi:hypothetical protein
LVENHIRNFSGKSADSKQATFIGSAFEASTSQGDEPVLILNLPDGQVVTKLMLSPERKELSNLSEMGPWGLLRNDKYIIEYLGKTS